MKQMLLKYKILIASLSATAVIGIAVVVAMFIFKDDEAYRTIKVIETVGQVNVIKDGSEYNAYPGMVLEEGYELITAEDSYVRLVLDEDKYVKIEAGSKITFEKLGLVGNNKTKIKIESGAMTCEIVNPLKEDDDFIINTPNSVLAVRGTFFRVDLNYNEDGLVKTHVTTYGGVVAAQRVLSSGTLAGEEVDISAGNKAIISQINEVNDEGSVDEDVIFETKEITLEDIPDDDLIDVYFAIENGHEMFIDKEAAKEVLEIRDINIEEHISIYEKVKLLEEDSSMAESSDEMDSADDDTTEDASTGETETEETTTEEPSIEEVISEETSTEEVVSQEETTTENVTEVETSSTEITTQEITTEEATTEEITTEEITTEETTVAHSHSYSKTEVLAATCVSVGKNNYTCDCGDTYTEEIAILEHNIVVVGEKEVHAKCNTCTTYTEDGNSHEYEISVTKDPSCEELGIRKYTCQCGYSYTEDIEKEPHVEVGGGEEGVHKKCNVCDEVIEDGTAHYYTEEVIIAAECQSKGQTKYSCNCGYSYTVDVPALGHKKSDENASVTTCERCGADWVDINEANFEDEVFRNKLAQYDLDSDGYIIGTELTGITNLNLAGTADEDGGVMSLSGIELLPNVTVIDCSYNADLTQVDFSENTKLYQLYLNNTGVESINVSGCIGLSTLKYSDCEQLKSLDVSNTTLTSLVINSNPALQTLNVDGTSFTNLRISGTQITSLTLSNFSKATNVTVNDSPLQTLTISNCKVGNMSLNDISQLESVVSTDSTISLINVANCSSLKVLSVPDSGASVSFRNDTLLETVNLSGTALSTSLEILGTEYTSIKSLDISNTSLNQLYITGCTTLTTLNVEGCESLTSVDASNTGISALDLTGCTSINTLNLNSTQIADMADVVVPSNANIYSLNIGSETSNDINLAFNADDITWFNSLTSLNLINAKLSNTDWTNIKSVLSTDNLSFLYMSGNNSVNAGSTGDYLTKLDLSGFMNIRELQIAELTDVTEINISNTAGFSNIDLSGFTNLVTFNASGSELMELNASSNVALETINVSNCTNLDYLKLNDGMVTYSLKSVDLTGCTALTSFVLDNCPQITSINFSDATSLRTVGLYRCSSITSVDFSYNTNLESVNLGGTGITTLNLSGKSNLRTLDLAACTSLTIIDISNTAVESLALLGCNGVTSINVTGNTADSMEVDVTDTSIDETYFTKSDGFTVNLVRQ